MIRILKQCIWDKIKNPSITFQRISPILITNNTNIYNQIDSKEYLKINYSSPSNVSKSIIKELILKKLLLNQCPVCICVNDGQNMHWVVGDDRNTADRFQTLTEIKNIFYTELPKEHEFSLDIIDLKVTDINATIISFQELEMTDQQQKELKNVIAHNEFEQIKRYKAIEGVQYIAQKKKPDPNELLFWVKPLFNHDNLYDNIVSGIWAPLSQFPEDSRGWNECLDVHETMPKRTICEYTSMIKFGNDNSITFCGNNQNKGFENEFEYDLHKAHFHGLPVGHKKTHPEAEQKNFQSQLQLL